MTASTSMENTGYGGVRDITHPPFQHGLFLKFPIPGNWPPRTSPWSHQTTPALVAPIHTLLSSQRGKAMGPPPSEGPQASTEDRPWLTASALTPTPRHELHPQEPLSVWDLDVPPHSITPSNLLCFATSGSQIPPAPSSLEWGCN